MAPTNLHHHQRRAVGGSTAFTLLFVLIAVFIVASVFIWAFVIPYIRKKYFPPKPSRTKFNQHFFCSSGSLPLIQPTHRHRERRSSQNANNWPSNVSVYDPRIQTPFPNIPSEPDSMVPQAWTPPRSDSPVMNAHQSLFTPVRDRGLAPSDQTTARACILPRVRPSSEQGTPVADREFGDAREYILTVPEPLHVGSRARAELVPSSAVGRMQDSSQFSSSADKHLHPNKLFEQLRNQRPQQSECSSTSLRLSGQPQHGLDCSLEDADKLNTSQEGCTSPTISEQLNQRESRRRRVKDQRSALTNTAPTLAGDDTESSAHNASVTAMHRIRALRSLVGAPPLEPLHRAGTLTRPKTPVATIRDMYNKKTKEPRSLDKPVSQNDTISTLFRTVAESSDRPSSQSSATSPPKGSPEPFTASSLSLLPTPLKIQRSPEARSISTPVRRGSKFKEELNYEERAVSQPIRDESEESKEKDNHEIEVPGIRLVASRPKPPPLTLDKNPRLPLHAKSPSRIYAPLNAKPTELKRLHIPSMQASSIYSRDTRGLSIGHTPVTPEFPYAGTFHPSFSPHLPSTIGDATDSDKATEANLIREKDKGKCSPVVHSAKEKVENWDVDTSELTFDTSPSASLKRALSTFGPEYRSNEELDTYNEQEDKQSIISTEIHPDEARLSCVVGSPLRVSGYDQVGVARASIRAPGDANWV